MHRYNATGLFHDMWGFPSSEPNVVHGLLRHLVDKIENRVNQLARYKEYYTEDAKHLLVSYGSSARSARHIVEKRRSRGERLGLLELQTLWPFPSRIVREKCDDAQAVVVVEMNLGQYVREIERILGEKQVDFCGQMDGWLISPDKIKEAITHG